MCTCLAEARDVLVWRLQFQVMMAVLDDTHFQPASRQQRQHGRNQRGLATARTAGNAECLGCTVLHDSPVCRLTARLRHYANDAFWRRGELVAFGLASNTLQNQSA